MIYHVDGWMIGKNPSPHGGGFTVVNEQNELVKRHTIYKRGFTNNDGEIFAIAYAAYIAAPGDTIITDSQAAYHWALSGYPKARMDLVGICGKVRKWIYTKDLKLEWRPREENLAGIYNDAHKGVDTK